MDAVYLGDAIYSCSQESNGSAQHQTFAPSGDDERRVLLLHEPERQAQCVWFHLHNVKARRLNPTYLFRIDTACHSRGPLRDFCESLHLNTSAKS